jgi:hypothetical protein
MLELKVSHYEQSLSSLLDKVSNNEQSLSSLLHAEMMLMLNERFLGATQPEGT